MFSGKSLVKSIIVYVYVCMIIAKLARCQFPRSCSDADSIELRKCCPTSSDGSQCGISSGRGSCQRIRPAASNLSRNETLLLLLDDRARWPIAFYEWACFCTGNFDGLYCSKCRPGYEGDRCEIRSPLKLRKNILSMSTAELQNYVEVLDKAKRVTSESYVILTTAYDKIILGERPEFVNASVYNVFVWMHAYVTKSNFIFSKDVLNRWNEIEVSLENRKEFVQELLSIESNMEINADVDYAHEGSGFLPWHRMYVLKWEQELRDVVAMDTSFTLPYWDWRGKSTCDVCNDVMLGGQDPNNSSLISAGSPFSQWEIICSHEDEYLLGGKQCTGTPEGPLFRNPGNYDPLKTNGLPTFNDVENIFRFGTDYDTVDYDKTANNSFRNLLEGFAKPDTGKADSVVSYLHNAVHLYFNGTMSSVPSSANDPVFLLHHVFVDNLFETWLNQENQPNDQGFFNDLNDAKLGHRPQDYMVPFFPLVQNREGFIAAQDLGYVYHPTQETSDDANNATIVDVMEDGSTTTNFLITSNTPDSFTETESNFFEIQTDGVEDSIFDVQHEMLLETNQITHDKGSTIGLDQSKKVNHDKRWWKGKHNRWNYRRFGEGGFSMDEQEPGSVLAQLSQSNMLIEVDRAENDADLKSTDNSMERFKKWLAAINRMFQNMSAGDVLLLVFTCTLLVSFSCLLICACRSRRTSYPKKRQSLRCCCCGYRGEPEEQFALLEKNDKVSSDKQVVKATLYTVS